MAVNYERAHSAYGKEEEKKAVGLLLAERGCNDAIFFTLYTLLLGVFSPYLSIIFQLSTKAQACRQTCLKSAL